MKYSNRLRFQEASPAGSDPCFSDCLGSKESFPGAFVGLISSRFKHGVPLCLGIFLAGQCLSLAAEDITEDVIKSGEGSYSQYLSALSYASNVNLGTISAKISAHSVGSHYAAAIMSTGSISIDCIAESAVIAARSDRNYGYGIYSGYGTISVNSPLAGAISATMHAEEGFTNSNSYGYGIFTKSGSIYLNGVAETGSITIGIESETGGARMFGMETENNGDIKIAAPFAGTMSLLNYGTLSYGFWAKEGGIEIDSFSKTASVSVSAGFSAYGFGARKDIVIGDIEGDITVIASAGNFAYGMNAAGQSDTDKSHIYLGNISGSIQVETRKNTSGTNGNSAYGVLANYGVLVTGDISGTISAAAEGETAYTLSAKYDVDLGDILEGAVISSSARKNAYAVYAGNNGRAIDNVSMDYLTMGNVDGKVTAVASEGYSVALFSRSDIVFGDLGSAGEISARSDSSGDALAVWTAAGKVFTGVINGRIAAETVTGDAYGIAGLGLNIIVGSTGEITATGENAFSIYSGCYQGSSFRSYNLADTITLHAGALIVGDMEIGGSGEGGIDNIYLLHGADKGVLDARILTTINTVNQTRPEQQVSDVRLTVGGDSGSAFWKIANQESGLFTGVSITRGSVLETVDSSLSIKEGGFINNKGAITGTGSIHIGSTSSLTTGHLSNNGAGALVLADSGIADTVQLTVESGARLGTTILNEKEDLFTIRVSDMKEAVHSYFISLIGESYASEDYEFTYSLEGNIEFGELVVIEDGDRYELGIGSYIEVESDIPDNSVFLQGGTLDVRSSDHDSFTSSQIAGSSGLLKGREDQSIHFTDSGSYGYDIENVSMVIGSESDGSSPEIVFGGTYDTSSIILDSGSMVLDGESAVMGRPGGRLDAGRETEIENNAVILSDVTMAGSSTMINNGVIEGSLQMEEGGLLKGTGLFKGEVFLGRNSSLVVGNSPGLQVYENSLHLGQGASLAFSIDGILPATETSSGAGTYSQIVMSGTGNTITLAGDNTLVLEIGSGIMNSESGVFSLILIDYIEGASADASFTEAGLDIVLAGAADLIDPGFILSFLDDSLVLNGTLNRSLIEEALAPEASRYANGLWSSTGVVRSFSGNSVRHLDFAVKEKTTVWAGGFGDFISLSHDGDSSGFESNHGGYAVGAVRGWNESWTTGLSFGQSFGTNKPNGGSSEMDQDAVMFNVAAQFSQAVNSYSTAIVSGDFAYGSVRNKVKGNDIHAKWDDNVFTAGVSGKWKVNLDEKTSVTPFAGLEFVSGSQDDFDQVTIDGARHYRGADLRRWIIPVGITFQGIHRNGDQFILPQLTVMYQGEVSRHDPAVKTSVLGQETSFRGSSPARNSMVMNAGIRWIIDPSWSVSTYYNIEYSSSMTNQSVNAGVAYTF